MKCTMFRMIRNTSSTFKCIFYCTVVLASFSCNKPSPPDDHLGCLEDTTSHRFIWEIDTLSQLFSIPGIGLNILNDMAVISDDDIWLVGYFWEMTDTGVVNYNALHWDGNEWELHRILGNFRDEYEHFDDLMAIYAFSPNDIWMIFRFGAYSRWDGERWESVYMYELNGDPHDMWGESPDDFYLVGLHGSIAHFNGSSFTPMVSGTDIPLNIVYGLDNEHVWTIGYRNDERGIFSPLLVNFSGSWVELHHQDHWLENWPPQDFTKPSGVYYDVWAYEDTFYLGCASIWKESISTGEGYLSRPEFLDWNYPYGVGFVDGNHCNDIFAFTIHGLYMSHYNGVSWENDSNLSAIDPDKSVYIRDVYISGNLVYIAALDNSLGVPILLRGIRI